MRFAQLYILVKKASSTQNLLKFIEKPKIYIILADGIKAEPYIQIITRKSKENAMIMT